MKKQEQMMTLTDALIRGGQVFSDGIRRTEPNLVSALKMLEPMTVLANLAKPFTAMSRGSQIQERRRTLPKLVAKRGKTAHTFDNLFPYNLQTSSDNPPKIERKLPAPVPLKPRENRGPGARVAVATRGGEIYSRTGEGQTTSKHRQVYTSIF